MKAFGSTVNKIKALIISLHFGIFERSVKPNTNSAKSMKLNSIDIAIQSNELFDFLNGNNKKYIIDCPYADMPTNPDQVFDAIKDYNQRKPNSNIWNAFENELFKMCTSMEGSWLSIYYLSSYLSFRKYSGKDFIDLNSVIQAIENGINKYKTELSVSKTWVGKDFEGGLLEDAMRLIGILNNKFGINIRLDNNA